MSATIDPGAPRAQDFDAASFHAQAMALHRKGEPWHHLTIQGQRRTAHGTANAAEVN